ncbi:MAG: class I SAM-dependent methyltransferase [Bacteroidia bacterium]|nr:class I SAM-dependent methyltransferase [Bacteroidia bacterium]NND53194.1 class I SAM-dependent methyltransferase [Flavobacteriaceae bacterium]
MIALIIAYIKFWFRSGNQHGVHSPFVYDLITKCFYDKKKYPIYAQLKNYREQLRSNDDIINVTDLGVGNQVMNSDTIHIDRKVSFIAKRAGTTTYRAKLLFRLVHYFKFENILELGSSLGIGTYAMSLGNPSASITSIEGCPNISRFTAQNLKNNQISNVEILTGNFDDVLNQLDASNYDLIFVDGNHQKEATVQYFELLLPKAHNDSVFIFDDIYWSKGMTEAWNIIKDHPQVTVSIDTFFWGFIFFRKEQPKEHFRIRL